MIIKMSISENIKSLRAQHGMSQDEFGKIAGLTGKAVSTWENGTKEPRLGAIQKLADYFHISKSEIIEGPDFCPTLSE
jgi:repressor LexA